ncbi:MAG TPA: hypothetical protein VGE05_00370 [Novosphingobium sp.]
MAEEHTTIIETAPRRSGGTGIIVALVLVLALVIGFLLFSGVLNSEATKDNAVAGAAQQVGNAAEKVGNAAETAAENTAPDGK